MADKVVLKFRVGMAPYQAGEVAAFTSREAEKILARRVATVVDGHHRVAAVEQALPELASDEPNLEELTKAELQDRCAALGLEYTARMTKAALLDLLRGGAGG